MKIKKSTRGRPLLDSIDFRILKLVNNMPHATIDNCSYSVLKIGENLKINHNNLKPHIDKLIDMGLLCKIRKGKSLIGGKIKIGVASIRVHNEAVLDYYEEVDEGEHGEPFELSKNRKKEMEIENRKFDSVISLLTEAERFFQEKENTEKVGLDLRSNKGIRKIENFRKI